MRHYFLLALPAILALYSCSQSIRYTVVSPAKPATVPAKPAAENTKGIQQRDGICYTNCVLPDQYVTKWVTYPIYIGADEDAPTRVETLVVEPAKSRWVKKETGEVLLERMPAVEKTVRILADTFFYRDYRYERFETKVLAEKAGIQRPIPVVCSEARTPSLFLQISSALTAYGYMTEAKKEWDNKFSQAIQQFQKDNSLPIGDLNLETLQFLGI
jgi:Putative peptidoglycan binding domain